MSLLLAGGASPPAAAPFHPAGFDGPAKRKQAGESGVAVNLLLTVLAVAVVVRAPVHTPRVAPKAQPQLAAPNLLLTTLAASEAIPFSQADWPNVARRVARHEDLPPNLLLAPGLTPPFIPVEWQKSLVVRGHPWDVLQNTLGTTLAPVAQSPFAQFDWTLPKAAARAFKAEAIWPNTALLSAPAAVVPFALPWADGQRPIRFQGDTLTWVQNLQQTTLAPELLAVSEWIIRARRRGRR